MFPKQLRTLGTAAAVLLGGFFTLNLASTATIGALRFAAESKRVFGAGKGCAALCGLQEVKGFIYASFAKGMPPLNGRRCTTQLPSTPAFAPPVMEIGCSTASTV